jgi:hypothetical protein
MGGPVRAQPLGANQYSYSDTVQLSDTAQSAMTSGGGEGASAPVVQPAGRIDLLA